MKKVHIEYNLIAASGVLISSTAEVLSIGLDKSTIRRRRIEESGRAHAKEPVIPGSTIKGKLRNECERILASLGWQVCRAPRSDAMCPHDPAVDNPPCAVCQMFGSPNQQSRLFFSDAIAQPKGDLGLLITFVQTGVSLSRRRRTAEDEKLYYMERGSEGLVYEGRIEGYLNEDTASQQLFLIIAALENLVAVGASKSRGAGWICTKVVNVVIDGQEVKDEMRKKGLEQWRESK